MYSQILSSSFVEGVDIFQHLFMYVDQAGTGLSKMLVALRSFLKTAEFFRGNSADERAPCRILAKKVYLLSELQAMNLLIY